jgi:hypothetical protein
MLFGEVNREAPAQRSFALPAPGLPMSKRQRVEWASCVNLRLNAYGCTLD